MVLPKFLRKRSAKITLIVVLGLVVLRMVLPYIVLHFANKRLANMDGYYGHIKDIDIALYRGGYVIDSLFINKVDKKTGRQAQFISAHLIDLSVEWKAIFKGKIVGELVFEKPVLRFTKDRVDLDEVAKDTSDFRDLLKDFMPLNINRTEIRDGALRYVDFTDKPHIDLWFNDLDVLVLNLRNAYKSTETLPASIEATGMLYGGKLRYSMKLNPLSKSPVFDLNAQIEKTDLVAFNELFMAYGGFDVNKGNFSVYAEAATKDKQFIGYVKPLITDLDVVDWHGQDRHDGFLQKIWESIVGGTGEIFKNHRKDQFGTRVNFSGSLEKPKADLLQSVLVILQNAFIQALKPDIEDKINIDRFKKS